MRDGQATRRRLLEAATSEFAARGISGARVDRIAAAARTNKAQMYSYYGSKDGLFDAVFHEHLVAILDAVPLDAEDLPGYAARLYDAHQRHPEFVRLAAWARLERTPAGELILDPQGHPAKLAAIADAQRRGLVDPVLQPDDVLATVIAIAMTWSPISITYAASQADDDDEHERRRRVLHETVRRTIAPARDS